MTTSAPEIRKDSTLPLAALTVAMVEECLDLLATGPGALDDEETVHTLRVATKRLRAAWHLVRDLAGKELSRERREALRELSALLSSSRDLAVLDRLAQELAARQSDGRIALALDVVRKLLRQPSGLPLASPPGPGDAVDSIRRHLEAERDAWHRIEARAPDHWRRAIRHELRRSRNRARNDARGALRTTEAELWHDWRKTVKRLRYQREFVARMQGREPGKSDSRISRLGSRLGERNDLANLATLVDRLASEECLSSDQHGLVRKAIAIEEARLIANCRRLGRLLFLRR